MLQDGDLELIFSRFGAIKSCEIVRDWKTGDSLQDPSPGSMLRVVVMRSWAFPGTDYAILVDYSPLAPQPRRHPLAALNKCLVLPLLASPPPSDSKAMSG